LSFIIAASDPDFNIISFFFFATNTFAAAAKLMLVFFFTATFAAAKLLTFALGATEARPHFADALHTPSDSHFPLFLLLGLQKMGKLYGIL
jgi:hypothetical protein